MNKKREYNLYKQGFTLVEVLVSILIFSLLTGAIASAVVTSTRTLTIVNEKLIATYLAQDAMEYIKNIRDTQTRVAAADSTNTSVWYGDALGICINNICTVDTTIQNPTSALSNCPSGNCDNRPLLFRRESSEYMQDRRSGEGMNMYDRTPFVREVRLSHPNTEPFQDELLVEVTVRWDSYGKSREVELYHTMFNW